jgi:ADP-ribosylglycohydrolase
MALQSSENDVIRALLHAAADRAVLVRLSDSDKYITGDTKSQGYLGVALQSAFYELLHATSFTQAVVDAVERGGDTDTNGAIVGAMLGKNRPVGEVNES